MPVHVGQPAVDAVVPERQAFGLSDAHLRGSICQARRCRFCAAGFPHIPRPLGFPHIPKPLVGRPRMRRRGALTGAATPEVGPESAAGWEPPTASATAVATGPACDADSYRGRQHRRQSWTRARLPFRAMSVRTARRRTVSAATHSVVCLRASSEYTASCPMTGTWWHGFVMDRRRRFSVACTADNLAAATDGANESHDGWALDSHFARRADLVKCFKH